MSGLVNVKGLDQLQAFLDQLPAKLEQNVMRGALRAGMKQAVLPQVKANVPVKTGTLRDGLKLGTSARAGTVTAKITATGKHAFIAPWLEFGVAAHQILAKKGGWLFFGGVFAKAVDHPGIQPRAFMRTALDAQAGAAVVAAAEYMKNRLATKNGLDTADITIEADT